MKAFFRPRCCRLSGSGARAAGWALLAMGFSMRALAADWPGWRGPARDGIAPDASFPGDLPGAPVELWRVKVGEGHASPIIAGQVVYVHSRESEDEVLRAIDLESGKVLWRASYPAPYKVNSEAISHGAGPKSTPTVADGKALTLGIGGILTCFTAASGEKRWQVDASGEFPRTSPLYGTAMSPLYTGGLCIAHLGGHDKGALRAFDAETGKVRWSWDADGPSYASPIQANLQGVEQIVTQTQRFLVGLELASGKELWRQPFTTEYDQNSVTSIIWKDRVIYSGYMRSLAALRLERGNSGFKVTEVWATPDVPLFMSSPVLAAGSIFGWTQKQKGQLFRMDPETGKVTWRGSPRGGENASIVLAGRHLLVLTTEGVLEVYLINGTGCELARKYKVSDTPTWAHLAVQDDKLLVKNKDTVICYTLRGAAPAK